MLPRSEGAFAYPGLVVANFKGLRDRLEQWSPGSIGLLGAVGVLIVAILDLLTGNGLAFSFFYLIPVVTVAWFGSFATAIAVAIAGAIAFPVTEIMNGKTYEGGWVPAWNFLVRAATCATVALFAGKLRLSLEHERTLSRTDTLTGAANFRHFYDFAQLELARAARSGSALTVAYLDVDNFKSINDDYGHAAGDEVLRRVAATLAAVTRETDLAARLGGDEFAVLLPETGADDAPVVLTRVHESLREEIRSLGYSATTSMGAITFNELPRNVDELLWPADQLMYAVKRADKDAFRHRTVGKIVLDPRSQPEDSRR